MQRSQKCAKQPCREPICADPRYDTNGPCGDGGGTEKETQMAEISQGTKVTWNWGQGTASGTVQKTYAKSITRSLKGTEVTRNGTKDDPALLIEQEDGDEVLKLSSEVDVA